MAMGSWTWEPPIVDNRAQMQPLTVMDVDRDGILDLVGIGETPAANNSTSLAIGYGVAPGSENSLSGQTPVEKRQKSARAARHRALGHTTR